MHDASVVIRQRDNIVGKDRLIVRLKKSNKNNNFGHFNIGK